MLDTQVLLVVLTKIVEAFVAWTVAKIVSS